MSDTFPRQYARTQRLTLGEPRDLVVTPDGRRVVFARSRAGDDAVNCLWAVDVHDGTETLLADPVALLVGDPAEAGLPPEERARRERLREGASGITGYATDRAVTLAAFAMAGKLFACDVPAARAWHVDVDGAVFDPHPDPAGTRIAYVRGRALWVCDLDGTSRRIAGPDGGDGGDGGDGAVRGGDGGDDADAADADTVSWGSADFVAAEEMGRYRGFWWAPDGSAIAACRVDVAPVGVWYISDPANPDTPPNAVRYPAAGTSNPVVGLHLCGIETGERIEVRWDRLAFPYLATVDWNDHGLAITVQSRDQRRLQVLDVDVGSGATTALWSDRDDTWVELVPGSGQLIDPGVPVVCADRDGVRRLLVDGAPVSPIDVQVRSIVTASKDRVVVTGNPIDDPTQQHVYRWSTAGFEALTDGHGVNTAVVGGDTIVVRSAVVERAGARWSLPNGTVLDSFAEQPLVHPTPRITPPTTDHGATAVLLPHDHDGTPLPVLLDPYGGPHAQRVVRSRNAFCTSQWFADQGFAVVVIDGRGTPGRGSAYERAVAGDLALGVLDDQVTGLHAAAARHPELDLDRVAIRGWSFGGYLAALAVLHRPDVFHAAIAGAPVTEWRLYDTHYTERYLGDPAVDPDVYDANSLLPLADRLTRPLLLVHGLADDNVVAAHTLRLSAALLAAGRPHEVLPLVGVTHMTPQEVVAENLLMHQLAFLRRSLGLGAG